MSAPATTYNLQPTTSKKGFTLIELMITVSIIAVLAAVGITTFSQSQKLARDAKRKGDLRSIAIALELYYQNYKHYPCTPVATPWQTSTTVANTFWITNVSDTVADTSCGGPAANQQPFNSSFIANMPMGPLQTNSEYTYTSSSNTCGPPGMGFWMFTTLENGSDPDAHSKKLYRDCNGGTLSQAYGPNQFMVFSN